MIEGCDYVSGPEPTLLRAAGKRFVCRYLSTPGNPKNLTRQEALDLHAVGISIVLVFETAGERALAGHAAGVEDAKSAQMQKLALRAPASVPVYFAVDFDAQPGQLEAVVAYMRGAASVLGRNRTGVYGGYETVRACARVCRWRWQTYAWSFGRWSPAAQLHQYANAARIGGASLDLDRAVTRRYGQWPPATAPKRRISRGFTLAVEYARWPGWLQKVYG